VVYNLASKWLKMHIDLQLYEKQPVITDKVYCVNDIDNLPKEQVQFALDNFEKKYKWAQWTIEDAEKRFRENWNLYLMETEDSSIIGWTWISFEGEVLNAYSNRDFKWYFSDTITTVDIMANLFHNNSKELGYKKLFAQIEDWNKASLDWAVRNWWVYDED